MSVEVEEPESRHGVAFIAASVASAGFLFYSAILLALRAPRDAHFHAALVTATFLAALATAAALRVCSLHPECVAKVKRVARQTLREALTLAVTVLVLAATLLLVLELAALAGAQDAAWLLVAAIATIVIAAFLLLALRYAPWCVEQVEGVGR